LNVNHYAIRRKMKNWQGIFYISDNLRNIVPHIQRITTDDLSVDVLIKSSMLTLVQQLLVILFLYYKNIKMNSDAIDNINTLQALEYGLSIFLFFFISDCIFPFAE
jgi:hypothetical protein